jgi:putative DNA primase/helicase
VTAAAPQGIDFADSAALVGDAAIAVSVARAEPQAVFPPGYTMTAKGLFFQSDDIPSLIAGPFEVVAQTRDRHNQAWGVLLQWRDPDSNVHRLALSKAMLAGDGREVRQILMDGGLHISPFTKDRNALQSFLSLVRIERRARAVSRVGWQDGAFALPDRTIASGGGDLVVYQGAAVIDHDYRAIGTLEGWQAEVARYGQGNTRLALALSSAFVGPLLVAAGAEGGGIHLRGPSSIGKSTALLAAGSVWGPPAFVRQWRATSNGLEGIAELANETFLVLDELAQLDPREAGQVAYLLANGAGKSRASQSGEARAAKRWRTFFLSSGEISLAEHARSDGRGRRLQAGQEVRILDIEANAGKGFGLFDTLNGHESGDALARAIKRGVEAHHGVAGPEFVERLLSTMDGLSTKIRVALDHFMQKTLPAGADGQVFRACQRFAMIAAAGEIATAHGILPWNGGEAVASAQSVFLGWMEARGGIEAAEDRRAVEQVRDFLSANGSGRFQNIKVPDASLIRDRAGVWREEREGDRQYLITPAAWRDEVCAGLDPKAVAAILRKKGYLVPDSSGKNSVSVVVPGMGRARFYIINQSIFGGDDA